MFRLFTMKEETFILLCLTTILIIPAGKMNNLLIYYRLKYQILQTTADYISKCIRRTIHRVYQVKSSSL